MVKNPPANAGNSGSILLSRKIPLAAEQLSQLATTTEPVCALEAGKLEGLSLCDAIPEAHEP